jgi:hypothetical protein
MINRWEHLWFEAVALQTYLRCLSLRGAFQRLQARGEAPWRVARRDRVLAPLVDQVVDPLVRCVFDHSSTTLVATHREATLSETVVTVSISRAHSASRLCIVSWDPNRS